MKWANFLHFYQPANQQKDILEGVVNQCYRPLFKGLLENQKAVLTINVSGGLLELLDVFGFHDVIEYIKKLYKTNRVEFTSTACYHAFLPLLPENEIIRQITANVDMMKKYIDSKYAPVGFFPPEMGISSKLISIVSDMGYVYTILDEISINSVLYSTDQNNAFQDKNSGLKVLMRQRQPSNMIMSGIERNSKNIEELIRISGIEGSVITAMDGETFGHHRPGLEKAFLDIFNNNDIEFVKLKDLLRDNINEIREVEIVDSTWASSKFDIDNNIQFISWKDPDNIIHTWQWELIELMLSIISNLKMNDKNANYIRTMADKALASDQFFWASAKPWWSVEMIESGAHMVLGVIEKIPEINTVQLNTARTLYRNIVSTAFEWQRSGKVREMNNVRNNTRRIPFKERTLERGGVEAAVYKAFIDMMKAQEQKAAQEAEYEKATLWRDAVYKIESKNDIYDAINAIDLLRMEISNEKVEKMLDMYTEEYKKIRGGQPEQRSN